MAIGKAKWYTINMAGDTPEMTIHGFIGSGDGEIDDKAFIESLKAIKGSGAKKLNVSINTGGGDVFKGLAIRDALKSSGMKVQCTVIGLAASMGSIVMLAGSKKPFMHRYATVGTHEAKGGEYGTADELQSMADLCRQKNGQIADLYADATGKPKDEVAQWLKPQMKWFTAQDCLDAGLIAGIVDEGGVTAAPVLTGKQPKEVWAIYNSLLDETTQDKNQNTNTMTLPKMTARQLALKEGQEYTDAEIQMAVAALHQSKGELQKKYDDLNDILTTQAEAKVDAMIKAKFAVNDDRDDLVDLALNKPALFDKMFEGKKPAGNITGKIRQTGTGNNNQQEDEDAVEDFKMTADEQTANDSDKPYTALSKLNGGKTLGRIKKEAPKLFKDIQMRQYGKLVV